MNEDLQHHKPDHRIEKDNEEIDLIVYKKAMMLKVWVY